MMKFLLFGRGFVVVWGWLLGGYDLYCFGYVCFGGVVCGGYDMVYIVCWLGDG